jgi:hypothetical protein
MPRPAHGPIAALALATILASAPLAPGSPIDHQITWDASKNVTTVRVGGTSVTFPGRARSVSQSGETLTVATEAADGETAVTRAGSRKVTTRAKVVEIQVLPDEVRLNPAATDAANLPPALGPAGPAPAQVPTELNLEQYNQIAGELATMLADADPVSSWLIHEILMETAERRAAGYLRLDRGRLPASVRNQLTSLVSLTMQSTPVGLRSARRGFDGMDLTQAAFGVATASRWASGTASAAPFSPRNEAMSRSFPRASAFPLTSPSGEIFVSQPSDRCECIYCHPLHAPGTCPLPYAPPTVPVPVARFVSPR